MVYLEKYFQIIQYENYFVNFTPVYSINHVYARSCSGLEHKTFTLESGALVSVLRRLAIEFQDVS